MAAYELEIDGSSAEAGAERIVKSFESIQAASTRMEESVVASAKKMVAAFGELSGIKTVSKEAVDSLNNLSSGLAKYRGPSKAAIDNTNGLLSVLAGFRDFKSPSSAGLNNFLSALDKFRGPTPAAGKNVKDVLAALQGFEGVSGLGSRINSFLDVLSGFRGPNASAGKNVRALFESLQSFSGLPRNFASSTEAFVAFAEALDITTAAFERLRAESKFTIKAPSTTGTGLSDSLNTGTAAAKKNSDALKENATSHGALQSAILRTQSFLASLGGVFAFKWIANAGTQLKGIESQLEGATGSVQQANIQFQFLKETSEKLGLDFVSVADSYGKLLGATKSANISFEQTQEIFTGFSTAARSLHLSNTQIQGVFNALGQMFSKGKIVTEELRRQLGNELPGAFARFAAAAGATKPGQFEKMLQSGALSGDRMRDVILKVANTLQNEFAPTAEKTSQTVLSAFNRLKNSLVFKAGDFDESGFNHFLISLTDTIRKFLDSNAFNTAANVLAKILGFLGDHIEALATVVASYGVASMIRWAGQTDILTSLFGSFVKASDAVKASVVEMGVAQNAANVESAASYAIYSAQAEKRAAQGAAYVSTVQAEVAAAEAQVATIEGTVAALGAGDAAAAELAVAQGKLAVATDAATAANTEYGVAQAKSAAATALAEASSAEKYAALLKEVQATEAAAAATATKAGEDLTVAKSAEAAAAAEVAQAEATATAAEGTIAAGAAAEDLAIAQAKLATATGVVTTAEEAATVANASLAEATAATGVVVAGATAEMGLLATAIEYITALAAANWFLLLVAAIAAAVAVIVHMTQAQNDMNAALDQAGGSSADFKNAVQVYTAKLYDGKAALDENTKSMRDNTVATLENRAAHLGDADLGLTAVKASKGQQLQTNTNADSLWNRFKNYYGYGEHSETVTAGNSGNALYAGGTLVTNSAVSHLIQGAGTFNKDMSKYSITDPATAAQYKQLSEAALATQSYVDSLSDDSPQKAALASVATRLAGARDTAQKLSKLGKVKYDTTEIDQKELGLGDYNHDAKTGGLTGQADGKPDKAALAKKRQFDQDVQNAVNSMNDLKEKVASTQDAINDIVNSGTDRLAAEAMATARQKEQDLEQSFKGKNQGSEQAGIIAIAKRMGLAADSYDTAKKSVIAFYAAKENAEARLKNDTALAKTTQDLEIQNKAQQGLAEATLKGGDALAQFEIQQKLNEKAAGLSIDANGKLTASSQKLIDQYKDQLEIEQELAAQQKVAAELNSMQSGARLIARQTPLYAQGYNEKDLDYYKQITAYQDQVEHTAGLDQDTKQKLVDLEGQYLNVGRAAAKVQEDYGKIVNLAQDQADTIVDGFKKIVDGTESFKSGLKDIFKGLKDDMLNFTLYNPLRDWLKNAFTAADTKRFGVGNATGVAGQAKDLADPLNADVQSVMDNFRDRIDALQGEATGLSDSSTNLNTSATGLQTSANMLQDAAVAIQNAPSAAAATASAGGLGGIPSISTDAGGAFDFLNNLGSLTNSSSGSSASGGLFGGLLGGISSLTKSVDSASDVTGIGGLTSAIKSGGLGTGLTFATVAPLADAIASGTSSGVKQGLTGDQGATGTGMITVVGNLIKNTTTKTPKASQQENPFSAVKKIFDYKTNGSTLSEGIGNIGSAFKTGGTFSGTMSKLSQGLGQVAQVAGAAFQAYGMGKSIGKALGLGRTGSDVLGGAAAGFSVGGPVGAAVGAGLGLLKGLLYKAPHGASTITGSDGVFSAGAGFGNNKKAETAANAQASAIVDSINSVATSLGGFLQGNPNITVGTYKGKYRVNTQGTKLGGSSSPVAGLKDFGKDGEDAANAYALQQIIAGGYIGGIDPIYQQIAKASKATSTAGLQSDLDVGTSYISFVDAGKQQSQYQKQLDDLGKSYRTITQQAKNLGLSTDALTDSYNKQIQKAKDDFNYSTSQGILQYTDPLMAQYNDLVKDYQSSVADAIATGGNIADVEKLYGLKREDIIKQYNEQINNSIQAQAKSLITSLTASSSSPLSPTTILANAQKQFETLAAQLKSGDYTNVDQLQTYAGNYLDAAKTVDKSSSGFYDIYNEVMDLLNTVSNSSYGIGPTTGDNLPDLPSLDSIESILAHQNDDLTTATNNVGSAVVDGNAASEDLLTSINSGIQTLIGVVGGGSSSGLVAGSTLNYKVASS